MSITGLSRKLVYSNRGMVCSSSPLAGSAGIKAIRQGGSAFDAALAVAALEAVTLVPMCGLGGDSFILMYEAANGKVTGINSSGVAPTGATAEYYRNQGLRNMPLDGPHSIGVPGEVAAWEMYHQNFCTLPMDTLLEDAVHYAQEGFPLSPGIGGSFTTNQEKLAKFPATAAIMLPGGRTLGPGDVLVNRDLARSLTRVAQGGAGEFYRGELAKEMVGALQEAGGLFTLEDFAGHQAEMYQPIATTYAGHNVYQTQPPSQGFLMLEMLNLVEGFGLDQLEHNSAQAVHLMVEAKKIAYSDRNRLAGDTKIVEWPLDELISKEYGRNIERILCSTASPYVGV